MRVKNYLFIVCLSLFVVGTACESSTSNDPEELEFGKFKGVVGTSQNTGLYEKLEGNARFSISEIDSVFSLEFYSDFISDTNQTEIRLNIKSLEVPLVGVYNFIDVDTTLSIVTTGFTGLYISPTVGLNEKYYPESGSLTIMSSDDANGIKGSFEGVIFKNSEVDSGEYVRQYSTFTAEFYAAPS